VIEAIEIGDGAAVVVYDGRTGAIRHIHEEVTLSGEVQPDPGELTRRTLELARSLASSELTDVNTLLTTGEELRIEERLAVDVDERKLIARPHRRA
jgi:hypothetical protein